jgi:O-antigen/teichoic acid export membrane protein
MTESAAPRSSTMRRDILSAYVATGSRVLSWAIVSALVYRRMGPGAFATITLVRATLAVLNYASLGIAPAMIARLASAASRSIPALPVEAVPTEQPVLAYADPEANRKPKPNVLPVQTLYFSGLTMMIIAAMVGAVLLVGYAMLFQGTIRVAEGLRDETWFVVLVMGLGVLLRLVSDASGAVLQSNGRIATDNLILAATELLWLGLCAMWITDNRDDIAWVAGAFMLSSAFQLVARFLAAEFVARLTTLEMEVDWKAGREMLRYGLLVTLAQVADYLYAPTDFLLINQMLSPNDVAHYSPAIQIDSGLLLLVSGLAGVLLPKAAIAHAAGDAAKLRAYYVRATLASFALLASGAAAVWGLSPWLFRLWLGEDMPVTRAILPLVLISTVVGGSGMVGRSILIAIGKAKPFMIAALIAGVANVVLSIAFVRMGFGLRGIVYGTVIVVVARAGIWLPWYVLRTLRLVPSRGTQREG